MDLYIANTTKQNHCFTYRIGERVGQGAAFMRVIKPGAQIVIEDLDQDDIDSIVKQHQRYGLKRADEMSRRKGITGVCWSTTPINVDRMLETFSANDELKDDAAQARRETTAAAISDSIGKEIGKVTGGAASPPERLEVEVIEQTRDSTPSLAAGVRVFADPAKAKEGRRPHAR